MAKENYIGKTVCGNVFADGIITPSKNILGSVALRNELSRALNPAPLSAFVDKQGYKVAKQLRRCKYILDTEKLEITTCGETVIISKSYRQKGAIEITFHAKTDDFQCRIIKPAKGKGKDPEAFLGLMDYVVDEMNRFIKINKLRRESSVYLNHMSRTNYYDAFEEVLEKGSLSITRQKR